MSDTVNTTSPATTEAISWTLGGQSVAFISTELKGRKKKDGTTSPDVTVITPQAGTLSARALLVTAVLTAAEVANPEKGGESLIHEWLFDRSREATAVGNAAANKVAEAGGTEDEQNTAFITAYNAEFVNTKVVRGDSLKALNDQLNDNIAAQLVVFKAIRVIDKAKLADANYTPDAKFWAEVNAQLGTNYSEEDQLLMRSIDLEERHADIQKRIDKKQASSAKAKATKTATVSATPATAEPHFAH